MKKNQTYRLDEKTIELIRKLAVANAVAQREIIKRAVAQYAVAESMPVNVETVSIPKVEKLKEVSVSAEGKIPTLEEYAKGFAGPSYLVKKAYDVKYG